MPGVKPDINHLFGPDIHCIFVIKYIVMAVFSKGSKFYSIFKMRCPRCQEGDFFKSHPYNLKKAGDIYKNCPKCDLKYSPEPGFYFGALFVSYALGVALFVTFWVAFNLFFEDMAVGLQILIIVIASIVTAPYFYSLSKIIWANMFMKYNGVLKSEKLSS